MTMSEQLKHLAQAYFHQDYDLEFVGPDAVILAFAEGEGDNAVRELISEIDALLALPLDEAQLAELWIGELTASYDPAASGQSHREWLGHARNLLSLTLGDSHPGSP